MERWLTYLRDSNCIPKFLTHRSKKTKIVDKVCELQEKGRKGELKRVFTLRGKGRSVIQFGCCFNYRTVIITGLIKWHILPPTCVPDCCVVNIYEEGDRIPPHIDSHDFRRPFCTVSFLNQCLC